MKIGARFWLPVAVWMALILAGSGNALSARQTSRFIRPLLTWLLPDAPEDQIDALHGVVRKMGHVTEYAVMAILLWRARRKGELPPDRPWSAADAAFALVGSVCFACVDEWRQSFLPSRTGTWKDVAIDGAGAVIGLCLVWLLARWMNRRRGFKPPQGIGSGD